MIWREEELELLTGIMGELPEWGCRPSIVNDSYAGSPLWVGPLKDAHHYEGTFGRGGGPIRIYSDGEFLYVHAEDDMFMIPLAAPDMLEQLESALHFLYGRYGWPRCPTS